MTTSFYADRCNLFHLMHAHPNWSQQTLAEVLGRSKSWVYKWQTRFAEVADNDEEALYECARGLSRARHTPPESIDSRIEELILEIRDNPSSVGLRRTPGPKAILYYLPLQITIMESHLRLPTSTRTVYLILDRNQRIAHRQSASESSDLPLPAPLSSWQIDFKDVTSVKDDPVDPTGKKQHVAEAFNIVDEGTSLLLFSEIRTDYTAETLLETLGKAIDQQGVPKRITLDRDPRSVGAPKGSDFPSALLRFGRSLGIDMHVCPPRHPWENGKVERYHRTYQEECINIDQPETVTEAQVATADFQHYYNNERPNQAVSCDNQPPQTAFPVLPTLPRPSEQIDVDTWLKPYDGKHFERKIDRYGFVQLDLRRYYVDVHRAKQRVTLEIVANDPCLRVWSDATLLKTVQLKGIFGTTLTYADFVKHMAHLAKAQHRLRTMQERHRRMA